MYEFSKQQIEFVENTILPNLDAEHTKVFNRAMLVDYPYEVNTKKRTHEEMVNDSTALAYGLWSAQLEAA